MQAKQQKVELSNALGRVITKLRKQSNISARALVYGTNLAKTSLLLAEKGKLDPQLSTFFKIAEIFYKTPDELMKMVIDELPSDWFSND